LKGRDVSLNLGELSEKQTLVFESKAREILFGGALGPGKSHLLRVLSILYALKVPYLQIYLFRRTKPEILPSHLDGPTGYRALLQTYVEAQLVTITEDEIRFNTTKAKIHLCHCQDLSDRYKYQSAEMHILLIDESTTFEEEIIRYLRTRVRCFDSGIVPEELKDKIPFIVYASNPGGVSHHYFKKAFVDPAPPGEVFKAPVSDGGFMRQYVPAILSDNRYADESYADQVRGLGNPELERAYLNGDWNINLGCFFPEFCNLNVIKPFSLPKEWTKIRLMDWGGSRDPCYVAWMTVTPEDWALEEVAPLSQKKGIFNSLYATDRRIIPKNSRIIYREWYIADESDKGVGLSNNLLAKGIIEREGEDTRILYGVTGRDTFISRGGPSIASQVNQVAYTSFNYPALFSRMADIRRIPGWQEMRSRIVGVDGYPEFYVFDTCRHTIRLIPAMQHKETKPEDAEDYMDHCGDGIRYGLMSYITPNKLVQKEADGRIREDWSLNTLWKEKEMMEGGKLGGYETYLPPFRKGY